LFVALQLSLIFAGKARSLHLEGSTWRVIPLLQIGSRNKHSILFSQIDKWFLKIILTLGRPRRRFKRRERRRRRRYTRQRRFRGRRTVAFNLPEKSGRSLAQLPILFRRTASANAIKRFASSLMTKPSLSTLVHYFRVETMFVERKVHHSALFTNLVGWHAGAVSFPLSDIILAELACPLSDVMSWLHSGITNLSLYKHWVGPRGEYL
jgi:hypothetical protein